MMTIDQYAGTYRGFSPTDESPVGMGELEVIIDTQANLLKVRMATGLEIQEGQVSLATAQSLPAAVIAEVYEPDSEYIKRSAGFELEGRQYIFITAPADDEPALIVRGGLGDLLGPTMLFNKEQVDRGVFDTAIGMIEQEFGKPCVPQLKYEGEIPPGYYEK